MVCDRICTDSNHVTGASDLTPGMDMSVINAIGSGIHTPAGSDFGPPGPMGSGFNRGPPP